MGKHVGVYDLDRDIEQHINETTEHESWCHWDCPGHRSCVCRDMFHQALVAQAVKERLVQ